MRYRGSIFGWLVYALKVSLVIGILGPQAAQSQDFVRVQGRLSDADFYRVVACAAKPGEKCRRVLLKWPKARRQNLTVAIAKIEGSITQRQLSAVKSSIASAVKQINAVGADIKISFVNGRKADISVNLINTDDGRLFDQSNDWRREINTFAIAGFVSLDFHRGTGRIRAADVTLSSDLPRSQLKSIVLEEIVQSLGLLIDIEGRYYRSRSIFSETENRIKQLRGQDAMALRVHYPKDG